MANVLAGFRPVKHLNGSPYNGQVNRYMVPAADATALNVGDLVILSDGAAAVDTLAGVGVYPAVERAGTSTTAAVTAAVIVGAVVGFEPDFSNLNNSNVRLASTRRVALVADSPDLIFAAPQDAGGGVVAAASVGLNAALIPGLTSTTGNVISGMSVDSSSVATTNTLPLRVVGVTASPDQNVAGRTDELLVMINTHQYANGSTGV